jgi:hypothetical protein
MFKFVIAALLALSTSFATPVSTPHLTSAKLPVAKPSQSEQIQQFLAEPVAQSDPHLQGIRLVRCINGGRQLWSGSMVHYNNRNQYLTAAHVAAASVCFDAATRMPLKVNYIDKHLDFAVFESPIKLDNMVYKLSCQHFRQGHTYHAVGWAEGNDLTAMDLVATEKYSDKWFIIEGTTMGHMKEFHGMIIPGQSGGAVMDENWTAYGVNNASDDGSVLSWSRELADTPLCKK